MRIGLTIPIGGLAFSELPALVRRAEDGGYDSVWSEESVNLDGVTPLVVAAQHSTKLRIASGVLNVFTRGPALLAQTAAALNEVSGGRFVLGLGTSSNVIVEQWNGISFDHPLEKMRDTVENLRRILAGERGAGGFRLPRPPETPVPIVIAALRPKMLGLAARLGDGAFTNFLPISGAARVAEAFASPEKELACRFFSIPGPIDDGLVIAKRTFVAYATVPVYTEFFRWLGWGASVEPVVAAWQAGERATAVDRVPEDLVREVFLLGEFGEQRARLAEFAARGVTTAIIAPIVGREVLDAVVDAFAPRS